MKTQLIVRIRPGSHLSAQGLQLEWVFVNREGQAEGEFFHGSLEQLTDWWQQQPAEAVELPVCVIVPGNLAVSHELVLDDTQRKHWQQVTPFLFEEQLASDLETQHLVSSLGQNGGFVNVANIAHEAMTTLLDVLIHGGIDPQKIFVETQLFPVVEGALNLWVESDACYLMQIGKRHAQLLDYSAALVLIEGLMAEETESMAFDVEEGGDTESETAPQVFAMTLHAVAGSDYAQKLAARAEQDIPVSMVERGGDSLLPAMLPVLAEKLKKRQLLDLRTGSYKCARRASKQWRQWRPVAYAAGIWLVVELLFSVGTGFYFQSRSEQLRVESKDITPRGMDYNESNARLSLDVQAVSFDALNRYLEQLRGAGLNAKMETGNQDAQGVSARLTLRRA